MHGFGESPKIRKLADPVSETLDLSNPKSIGFDRRPRTIILCQVSRHSDHGFSFHHANIPTLIHTRTHRGEVIAISADNKKTTIKLERYQDQD